MGAPGKKKRKVWPWIVGVFVVLGLLMGGCLLVVYSVATGPVDAGNEWLAAIKDENYADAASKAELTCFDDNDPGMTESSLAAELAQTFEGVVIVSYNLDIAGIEVNDQTTTGSTSGTITFANNDVRTIELLLVDSDGWKLCGFDIGAAEN